MFVLQADEQKAIPPLSALEFSLEEHLNRIEGRLRLGAISAQQRPAGDRRRRAGLRPPASIGAAALNQASADCGCGSGKDRRYISCSSRGGDQLTLLDLGVTEGEAAQGFGAARVHCALPRPAVRMCRRHPPPKMPPRRLDPQAVCVGRPAAGGHGAWAADVGSRRRRRRGARCAADAVPAWPAGAHEGALAQVAEPCLRPNGGYRAGGGASPAFSTFLFLPRGENTSWL